MAMLRVSSYRRLFEEERWRQSEAAGLRCGGQFISTARAGGSCREPDFEAAKALNREALTHFARDRALIGALNDRLVFLMDMARCLEQENECLEAQILEMEERLHSQQAVFSLDGNCGLEAVVERLRREKEQIVCDTEEMQRELELLKARHEEAVQRKTLLHLEREEVTVDVDVVAGECLALQEQVAIYEEQLATMEEQHKMRMERLAEPTDGVPAVSLEFTSPDPVPAIMDIKEYYCQLAEMLQYECEPAAVVVEKRVAVPAVSGAEVAQLKTLIAELQRELTELEKCGHDLEDELEEKKAAHAEEIAQLECCVAELEDAQAHLEAQMREQCEDYRELLGEKMARDVEIAAYRGLVEEEEGRFCLL